MTEEFCVELDGLFGYKRARIFPSQALGVGSYGSVYTAVLDELPCAAKVLQSFFGMHNPGPGNFTAQFKQECRFLSDLKHPRLVQLLGLAHDPHTACPILLMELMDESLTQFLKRQTCPLPLHEQVNLTYDVTLALAYLHSNKIIHRNLSSNNVLLVGGIQAKVTDFGMFKMADINPRMISIAISPENQPFMPPEFFLAYSTYSNKVDIFSAGVLTIQIITREFPAPTKSKRMKKFPESPTGVIEIPVPERERRNNDISRISSIHPLLSVALDCLNDKHGDRPSAGQLCRRLAALKETPSYAESMQGVEGAAGQGNISTCTCLEKGRDIGELQGVPQQKKMHPREGRYSYEPQQKKLSLQESLQQLAEKDEVIEAKDNEITQLQKNLKERNEEVVRLKQIVEKKNGDNIPSQPSISNVKIPLAPKNKLKLQCQVKKSAPENIMDGGTAVVCGNIVYCMAYSSYMIHGYILDEDQWKIKLNFPRCNAALTIISGQLTCIGGSTSNWKSLEFQVDRKISNELTSWKENGWEVVLSPMKMARTCPAVVSIDDYIIVVGGDNGIIEVFTIQTNSWSTFDTLPNIYGNNITLCGERLYISSRSRMYSISIESFKPKKDSSAPSALSIHSNWREHGPIDCYNSLSTIRNQVVAVGGTQAIGEVGVGVGPIDPADAGGAVEVQDFSPPRSFCLFDNGQWVNIGCVGKKTIAENPIVAVLSENSILVVGGDSNAVELYS